jgi:hypothetical protein
MTWNNDGHGLVGSSREIKGYLPSHSWAMKLSQLRQAAGCFGAHRISERRLGSRHPTTPSAPSSVSPAIRIIGGKR